MELQSCWSGSWNEFLLSPAYMDREAPVAGRQLAKAGHRLAALLNQIWSPTTKQKKRESKSAV